MRAQTRHQAIRVSRNVFYNNLLMPGNIVRRFSDRGVCALCCVLLFLVISYKTFLSVGIVNIFLKIRLRLHEQNAVGHNATE